jgi:hypothetical protein
MNPLTDRPSSQCDNMSTREVLTETDVMRDPWAKSKLSRGVTSRVRRRVRREDLSLRLPRTAKPEFAQTCLERRGLESQEVGCATEPAHSPTGALQHVEDMILLDLGQPFAARRCLGSTTGGI